MTEVRRKTGGLPPIESWRTTNGVQVLFVARHELPIVDLCLDFDAGSVRDPEGLSGVAELTRSLLFTGIARGGGRPALGEEAIEAGFDEVGAELSVDLRPTCLSIGLRTLAPAAWRDPAIDLLARGLAQPRFSPAILAREQARLAAWLAEEAGETERIAERHFAALVFAGHPLGVAPEPERLETITCADIAAFRLRHCGAQGATLTLVGDLRREQAEALAQRVVAGLPPGEAMPLSYALAAPPAQQAWLAHEASQAHLLLGAPVVPAVHAEALALSIANRALSWRLNEVVREQRGLAYDVASSLLASRYGVCRIGLKTRSDQAGMALGAVLDTVAAYARDGVDADDFERMRHESLRGYALAFDSNAKLLRQVADLAFDGLPLDTFQTWPERVARLTLDQASAAFARWLAPQRLTAVIVGGQRCGDAAACSLR